MKTLFLVLSIICGLAALYALATYFLMVDIGKMEGEKGTDPHLSAAFGAVLLAIIPTVFSFYFFKKFKNWNSENV